MKNRTKPAKRLLPTEETVVTTKNGVPIAVTRRDREDRIIEVLWEAPESEAVKNTRNLLALHEQLCSEGRALMAKKNHDYTAGSGDVLANFRGSHYLGIHPILGIQLRQQDKMMRIKTFVEKGALKVSGESVRDSIVDQINYLVLQYAYILELEQQAK